MNLIGGSAVSVLSCGSTRLIARMRALVANVRVYYHTCNGILLRYNGKSYFIFQNIFSFNLDSGQHLHIILGSGDARVLNFSDCYVHAISPRPYIKARPPHWRYAPRTKAVLMKNPFEDEAREFLVLVNDQGQYSLWPNSFSIPSGWKTACGPGSRRSCIEYVNVTWGGLRPGNATGVTAERLKQYGH
ncbi:MbtH family NRPS accessory protein [Rhizobium sp. ZPR3]|uniref:MbtH family NRPS accessory protein n=2 Tax=unclassified Rhizobium TaxID=2613769 RepID=A0AAU7S9N3_9HYPH